MIILDSENLRLREIKKFDIPTLESLTNDSQIEKYFFVNYSKEEYFANLLNWNTKDDYWGFMIEEDKKPKGHIFLLSDSEKEGIMGFFIGKEFRGNNLALKSTEILIPFAFEDLNLERIITKVSPENKISKRILEKLNFTYQNTQNISNHLYEVYFLLKENI